MTAASVVWVGAAALKDTLVPVGDLHVHPSNPRRGDLAEIAKSLGRWGQVRAILALPDGTIVAGNHTYLAAVELGWTHVAVVRNTFASDQEARAYLLADNRLGDQGEYDRAELALFLEDLERTGEWEGTGYVPDDLAHMRGLDDLANQPIADPLEPASTMPPPPEFREVVLLLSEDTQFGKHVQLLRGRYGIEGVTDTVVHAVHLEAFRLNQGVADEGS